MTVSGAPFYHADVPTHPEHTKWKALKTKHAQAIKAKGINFDRDFGPILDQLMAVRDKMDEKSRKSTKEFSKKAWDVADSYINQIKAKQLADPAAKELREFLIVLRTSLGSNLR